MSHNYDVINELNNYNSSWLINLENEFHLFTEENGPVEFSLPVPKYLQMVSGAAGEDDAIAPMTGTVTAVYSEAGAQVQKGVFFKGPIKLRR